MANVKEYVNYIVKMDNSSFKKGSKENQQENNKAEKSFKISAKSAIALGTATVGAGAGLFKMADMASDLNEAMNVITAVFGDAGEELIKWSETSIQAMGISQTQALKTAGVYGSMGASLGLTDKQAMDMAMSLTQLSSDLASFYNVSQDVASTALKGVFTGETESLKQFGIMIDETTLKQYGYNSNMSQSEKIMVRYKAIMDQTKDIQGDFARTSDGLANQTRILKEQFKQLATEIGQKLIPVVTAIVSALNDGLAIAIALVSGEMSGELTTALNFITTAFVNLIPYLALVVGLFVAFIGPTAIIAKVTTALTPLIASLTTAFEVLSAGLALLFSPMGFLILAIALLIGSVIQAGIQMGIWNEMLSAVGLAISSVANFVKTLVVTIIAMIVTIIQAITQNELFQATVAFLANAISALITVISEQIQIVVNAITKFIQWASQSAVVQVGLEALGNIIGFVIGVVGSLIGVVISVIAQFIAWLNESGLLQLALTLIETAVMAIITVISIILASISEAINAFQEWVASSEFIQSALEAVASVIDSISSAIEWMNDKIQQAISWFSNLASAASDALSNIPIVGGLFDGASIGVDGANAQAQVNNYYTFQVNPQDTGSYRDAYRNGIAMVQSQGRTL